MLYRNLGHHGPKVSALCLGTVKFGQATPPEECFRILDCAIDHGINIIDTAFVYGDSEEIIGRGLARSGNREKVLLATKIQPGRNDRKTILEQSEISLRRLQTDVIDLLQLHRPSPDIPLEETLGALDHLIRQGKVRFIGTSGFKAWQIEEALWVARELGLHRVVSEQAVYSLLCRYIEVELVPLVQTQGLGLLLWSPLGAGVLTGRYRRDFPPQHMNLSDAAWGVLETVTRLATAKGCTPSQLALAWGLHRPGVTCPIAGPRTVEQLVDNLGALKVQLDDQERQTLDKVAPPGWCESVAWLGMEFSRPSAPNPSHPS